MNIQVLRSPGAARISNLRRINWRLLLLLGFICGPLAWFGFTFFQQVITGGVLSHGDFTTVDLKAMGNFTFNDESGTTREIPARFRELDGKRIALEGMMWAPGSAGSKVWNCQLVYNIQKCCFSGPPQVQERVFLFGEPGQQFPFYGSMVRALGTLHVRIKTLPGGKVISVYDLTVESIEPT